MTARRFLACLATLPLAIAATGAPSGCTTFGEETSPPDAGPTTPEAGGVDSGHDATTDAAGGRCQAACPSPCLVDSLDGPQLGWKPRYDPESQLTFAGGRLVTTVPSTGSAAYLERAVTLTPSGVFHLSVAVIADAAPKNGTTLAKVVDSSANEVGIRVDDGRVHACVLVMTGTPLSKCSEPRDLPLQTPVRLTLDVTVPGAAAPAFVTFSIDCQPGDQLLLPTAELLRTDSPANVHLGIEGTGKASYDDLELRPSN